MSPRGHEWPSTCPCPGSAGTQRVFTGEAPSGPATSVTVQPRLLACPAQAGPSVRGRRGFSSILHVPSVYAHKISFHRKGQEAQPEAASTLLYVCMCVGAHTHAYTRVHARTHMHTHTYMHVCIHTCARTCTHVHTYILTHAYTHTCTHTHTMARKLCPLSPK